MGATWVDSITRRSVHYSPLCTVVSFSSFFPPQVLCFCIFPHKILSITPTLLVSKTMATLVLLRAASRRMMPPATSLVTMRALFFSTRVSDNFLSGASSLYAESMAELYENDPSSVPEVSSVDVYFHHHHHPSLFTRKV